MLSNDAFSLNTRTDDWFECTFKLTAIYDFKSSFKSWLRLCFCVWTSTHEYGMFPIQNDDIVIFHIWESERIVFDLSKSFYQIFSCILNISVDLICCFQSWFFFGMSTFATIFLFRYYPDDRRQSLLLMAIYEMVRRDVCGFLPFFVSISIVKTGNLCFSYHQVSRHINLWTIHICWKNINIQSVYAMINYNEKKLHPEIQLKCKSTKYPKWIKNLKSRD